MNTNTKERWRWVAGWKGYYIVSSLGRVKSVARVVQNRDGVYRRLATTFRRLVSDRTGHLQVTLWRNNSQTIRYVHQLVMEAFVGPCPKGMEVRHFPDRDPTNNRLDNLQYGTRKENFADRIIHGTASRGEHHNKAKLTEEQVRQIRQLCAENKMTRTEIARMFGVCPQQIGLIHRRKNWGHLA